jgi:hypothetical protein
MSYGQPDGDLKKPILVKIKTKDLDGTKPKIVPRAVILKHGTNQRIKWVVDQDIGFTINFDPKLNKDRCPFDKNKFQDIGSILSGPIVGDPGEKEQVYWYSVEVEGFEPIDPVIILW